MSNITDFIKNELYPSLFEAIDRALPEHNFKQYAGGWRSKTYLNGSPHKDRLDKTIVTKKAISYILEQGGESLSIVDYVIKRDGVEFIQAVNSLAKIVGLQLPENPNINPEEYKKYKEKVNILEDCNSYFNYCLEKSTGAEPIRNYLKTRGYSEEEVKNMELGFIPSQESLFKYLRETKNHSQSSINESVKLNKGIGSTHQLTITYRSGGSIKGFVVRTIVGATPKYLVSTGLKRGDSFFNLSALKGDKDLVVVEGYLDSLISEAKGINNVVALGGAKITTGQIKGALQRGAKSFTLCLDTDEAGKEGVLQTIEVILAEGVNRVYIVSLPEVNGEKTDPDSLIKESGVEALKEAIKDAIPYYEYKLNETLNKYSKIEEVENGLTSKVMDSLLDEIIETSIKIKDPTDRDRYKTLFTSLEPIKKYGITAESLDITLDNLTSSRDKENQTKELNRVLTDATKLKDKGDTKKALDFLDKGLKEVKLRDKATEFSRLLKTTTESEIKERQSRKPESLNTGYTIGGEDLLLPSSAISVLAAPTSHGKTTFLTNLALNVSNNYPNKEVYLFSYEEDADSVLTNTLNTHLDINLNKSNSSNRSLIKNYFATGSTDYIASKNIEYFKAKKEEFFKGVIESKRLNIHYCDYNVDTLIDAIRYLRKNTNIGAVFIDYIQLLNLPQGKYKTYSRQEEMKTICRALNAVAVDTGLPIILGAQFNRSVKNQMHLHPTNMGEAGDIERIANLIIGFWNNSFKAVGTDGELNEIKKKGIDKEGAIYAEILKNRVGRVGLNELLEFTGNTGKIKNMDNHNNTSNISLD